VISQLSGIPSLNVEVATTGENDSIRKLISDKHHVLLQGPEKGNF
jgi:hypothetical protein